MAVWPFSVGLVAAGPTPHPGASPFPEWKLGTRLPPEIRDVWCRPSPEAAWTFQLMVADHTPTHWVYRRDARIRRPLATLGQRTADGLPYLAPEIQLLYNSKTPRPKDEADFSQTLPFLDQERRQWLSEALLLVHPGHLWLPRLR